MDLRELNRKSWDDRLEARAHTYQLRGRFRFAYDCLVNRQPHRWLDLGTGNGFLPAAARPALQDVRICGFDFADNALRAAEALDEAVVADIDQNGLPFSDGSFDFITCLEVLEHLVLPDEALSEMSRVLKPGGFLVITVPNIQFIEYLTGLWRGKMPGPAADKRHMSIYTHRFLARQLAEAGFRVTKHAGCDASPAWLAKLSPRYLSRVILIEARKR